MSDFFSYIKEAIELSQKSKDLRAQLDLALKRYELAEAEFEVEVNLDPGTAEGIEASRTKLISLFEAYLDANIAARTFANTVKERSRIVEEELSKGKHK